VGAVAGAASISAYEEKRVLGAGSAADATTVLNQAIGAGLVMADGDYPVPDPFHPGCQIVFHCTTAPNGRQVCTSTQKCG
jgi:hypothetical protein